MKNDGVVELLAPVGSEKALFAAIKGGADAVYLGLSDFNARMKAENFTSENIVYFTELCHLLNVKVFVTVNTMIKSREEESLLELITCCSNANVDAFIVTDFLTINLIKHICPHIPMHASTQMGVSNLEAAQYLESLGVSRVVMARESLLSDIKAIKEHTNLEVESFVHGAMCVSYSGNCYFSSLLNGNSGNRGRCLQLCRLNYDIFGTTYPIKSKYALSMADLCTINHLDDFIKCKVDSFKIEGRLKSPEYVFTVTSAYKKAIMSGNLEKLDYEMLKAVFNRGGFTAGYNYDNDVDLMSIEYNNNQGLFIGKVKALKNNRYSINGNAINVGSGIRIVRGNQVFGGIVKSVEIVSNNCVFTCDVTCQDNDAIFLTSIAPIKFERPRLKVDLTLNVFIGKPLLVDIDVNNKKYRYTSDFLVEKSDKIGGNEIILNELIKLGNTDFICNKKQVNGDTNVFVPISLLKKFKNYIFNDIRALLLSSYSNGLYLNKRVFDNNIKGNDLNKNSNNTICSKNAIEITPSQLIGNNIFESIDYVVVSPNDYNDITIIKNALISYKGNGKIYLKLPNVARGNDMKVINKLLSEVKEYLDGLFCNNYYAINIANKLNLKVFGGYNLNISNSVIEKDLHLPLFVASIEINKSAFDELVGNKFVYAYGNFPMMTLTFCPNRLSGGKCGDKGCDNPKFYVDKLTKFKLNKIKMAHCYFELNNSVPHYLKFDHDNVYNKYYDCKNLTNDSIKRLLDNSLSVEKFTNGHWKNGVN